MPPLLHPTMSSVSSDNSSDSDSSVDDKTASSGRLPKLVDNNHVNNYGEWKIQAKADLQSLGLWKYIEGPESIPPIIPPLVEDEYLEGSDGEGNIKLFHVRGNTKERKQKLKAAKPWMKKNNIVIAKIFRSLSSRQLHFVNDVAYASEAWEILRSHYQPTNSALAQSLRTDLQGYRCSTTMNVTEWLDDMQRIYNSLIDMEPDAMSDRDFALTTINNLPQTGGNWNSFTKGLRERINQYDNCLPNPRPIRSVEFISAINHEFILSNKDSPEVSDQIFSARANAENKASKRPRPADTNAPSSSSKRAKSNKTCSNSNCNRKGHDVSECVTFGGGNEGNYPDWWRGPFNIHLQPKLRTKANNIPLPSHPAFARTNQQSSTTQSTTQPTANFTQTLDTTQVASFSSSDNNAETPDIILMSSFNEDTVITTLPVFDVQQPKSDVCYFDSGANRHVFNEQNLFELYQSITPIDVQGVGTDCLTKAIGRGNVRIHSRYAARSFSILLTDVLHIPRARSNLISGGQFDERGVFTQLGGGKASFTYRGETFLNGFLKNRLYHLNMTVLRPTKLPLSSRISENPIAATADALQPDFCTASWGTSA